MTERGAVIADDHMQGLDGFEYLPLVKHLDSRNLVHLQVDLRKQRRLILVSPPHSPSLHLSVERPDGRHDRAAVESLIVSIVD